MRACPRLKSHLLRLARCQYGYRLLRGVHLLFLSRDGGPEVRYRTLCSLPRLSKSGRIVGLIHLYKLLQARSDLTGVMPIGITVRFTVTLYQIPNSLCIGTPCTPSKAPSSCHRVNQKNSHKATKAQRGRKCAGALLAASCLCVRTNSFSWNRDTQQHVPVCHHAQKTGTLCAKNKHKYSPPA